MTTRTTIPAPEDLIAEVRFVRRLARHLVRDEHDAEDVAQDAIVAALDRPPVAVLGLRRWLGGVVRNTARMRRRSEGRRARRQLAVARSESLASAGEQAARTELLTRLATAVHELAEPYRTTLLLRYYDGLTPTEIAARTGVPIGTVKTRLRRGLARLRLRLDEESGRSRGGWRMLLLPLADGRSDAPVLTAKFLAAAATAVATLGAILAVLVADTGPAAPPPAPPEPGTNLAVADLGEHTDMKSPAKALTLLLFASSALAGEVDVRSYAIEAIVQPGSVAAVVVLTAAVKERPDTWELDLADSMQIRTLSVNGIEVPRRRDGWKLRLDLTKLPKDVNELTLTAQVLGAPRQNVGRFVRTIVTPEHARIRSQYAWYPRVPDDAATFRTVISVPKGWSVRTAGRRVSVEEDGERRVWTYEQETPVRRIGLAAGPYEVTDRKAGDRFVFDAWTLPGDEGGADAVLQVARAAFDFYRDRFGDVAVDGFSLVEMPADFGEGSGYGEVGYVLLGRGAFRSGEEAPWMADLVSHELAHTWWGREVGFRHFANESLASYAALCFVAETKGEDVARSARARAVAAIRDAAAKGQEVALADIRDWGAGMDPGTYRVHAYEKGMMILVMLEDAIGAKSLRRLLSDFIERNRGSIVGWPELRDALAKGGSKARTVLDQWGAPGIPKLVVEFDAKGSGKRWRVKGTITQSGTEKAFRMKVPVVAVCGDERVEEVVEITREQASFAMTTPAEPEAILVDPDWRLVVDAPRIAGGPDPKEVIDRAFAVVNSPNHRDPAALKNTVAMLSDLLKRGAGEYEGLCHTGIGRCRFRLGEYDEAKPELEAAIRTGGGGPFHRAWVRLRLGNIADLAGDRKAALGYYEQVVAPGSGASEITAQAARGCIERPYR